MKTLKLSIVLLFLTLTAFPQSKSDLLEQIDIYQKSIVLNKPYDAEKPKLFEAMNTVGASEYQRVLRESESRGFCEYYSESDTYRETLTMEIANDKQPYRVTFAIKKEFRLKDFATGAYSEWKTTYDISKNYLYKLQLEIYTSLFGPMQLPAELQLKIDKFNEAQTKERKKIINGRDY